MSKTCAEFEITCTEYCDSNENIRIPDRLKNSVSAYNICLDTRRNGDLKMVGQCLCVGGMIPDELNGFVTVGYSDSESRLIQGAKGVVDSIPEKSLSTFIQPDFLFFVPFYAIIYVMLR